MSIFFSSGHTQSFVSSKPFIKNCKCKTHKKDRAKQREFRQFAGRAPFSKRLELTKLCVCLDNNKIWQKHFNIFVNKTNFCVKS